MLRRILPVSILVVVLFTDITIAYTGSTEGTAGELYDVVVNQLLNGPAGVAGTTALMLGVANLVMGRIAFAVLSFAHFMIDLLLSLLSLLRM